MAAPTNVTNHLPTMQWLAAYPPDWWEMRVVGMTRHNNGWLLLLHAHLPVHVAEYGGPLSFIYTFAATILEVEQQEHVGGFSNSSSDPYWL